MRICVLGSNGFLGRHLVRGFPGSTGLGRNDLDLLDSCAVKKYFSENTYDLILHCAVVGGSRLKEDDWSVLDKNLRMFFNVMNATRCNVIYFSSGAALRNFPDPPFDPYGFSKYIIEQCPSPRLQILRIWGCFGAGEPSSRFLATAKREHHVTIQVDQEFDFFHVDDVIRVIDVLKDRSPVGPFHMVYPGKKYRLSEIADMAGVSKTICSTCPDGQGYTGEYNLNGIITLPTLKKRIKEYIENESI